MNYPSTVENKLQHTVYCLPTLSSDSSIDDVVPSSGAGRRVQRRRTRRLVETSDDASSDAASSGESDLLSHDRQFVGDVSTDGRPGANVIKPFLSVIFGIS